LQHGEHPQHQPSIHPSPTTAADWLCREQNVEAEGTVKLAQALEHKLGLLPVFSAKTIEQCIILIQCTFYVPMIQNGNTASSTASDHVVRLIILPYHQNQWQ